MQLPQGSGTQREVLWHGYVRYGDNHQFPVWAKVRITANITRVVAVASIPIGKPIQGNQVRLESCEDFPFDETVAATLDEVIGYLSKSSLHAGSVIRRTQIEPAPDVARGDLILVQVFAGGAYLRLEGRAESAGVKGSTILVRNLSSGKDFRAQVTGKNQATVGMAAGDPAEVQSQARTGPALPSKQSGTPEDSAEPGSVVQASSSQARTGPALPSKQSGTPEDSAEPGSVVRACSLKVQ